MLKYLDFHCKIKVTPSTVNENPDFLERMYRQAVALKESMKGQKKASFVKELTKQLKYMMNKVDDGRAFEELENFFKCKIQEMFSPAAIVDLQQQHEGSALSMEAIETIGGLGRRDLFNDDKTPKRFIRGVLPSRSTVQRAQRDMVISVERKLQLNDMVSAVYSEDGQSVVLNIVAVLASIIEDGEYLELGYGYPVDKEFGPTEEKKIIEWAFAVDGGAMTSYKGFLVSCPKVIDPELCRRLLAG